MNRMWINQPSTQQPLHHLHGVRVLACPDTDRTARAYLLSGDVINMQVPRETLSNGWPAGTTAESSRPSPGGDDAETIGLRIAERIKQELISGRQWSLSDMDEGQRQEFEAEITSTCVAVCEQEFAQSQ